jgi:hypothetical protein
MWESFKKLFTATDAQTSTTEPVVVATCNGPIEASMMVSQLQDAGIPAATLGAESAAVFGMQSGVLAEVRIIVPAGYLDAARELIDELDLRTDMTLTAEEIDTIQAEADEIPPEAPSKKE